jgi:hypothetical protein
MSIQDINLNAPENSSEIVDDSNFIWSIANNIRNAYMPDKYGDVIIPMTIIRRFECSLAPTKKKVIDLIEKYGDVSDEELYEILVWVVVIFWFICLTCWYKFMKPMVILHVKRQQVLLKIIFGVSI